jgi:hypothetical protein
VISTICSGSTSFRISKDYKSSRSFPLWASKVHVVVKISIAEVFKWDIQYDAASDMVDQQSIYHKKSDRNEKGSRN